ncbi:Uncharacterized protein Fot_00234 [Forsythia ovata]|uniref:Uncharacterized protein n=1 Tax=Forsythia ovata TaxID=205694 RepID=A0ABD1X0L2_9LAMI
MKVGTTVSCRPFLQLIGLPLTFQILEGHFRVSTKITKRLRGASEVPNWKLDLDGLTPFEKNFYVESPYVAAMSKSEVEEYRRLREITVEGKDKPKLVKVFQDVAFPCITWQSFLFMHRISF